MRNSEIENYVFIFVNVVHSIADSFIDSIDKTFLLINSPFYILHAYMDTQQRIECTD